MKNNILIIGSNSFSGSNFINYLLDKKFFCYWYKQVKRE